MLALLAGLAAVAAVALLVGVKPVPDLDLVRATVEPFGDDLRVITRWHAEGAIDAVRVSVAPDGAAALMSTHHGGESADTVLVAAGAGGTSSGTSCVVPLRGDHAGSERCTPWQFVRPSAEARSGAAAARIVVQPAGLQVDPDVAGRCAAWQDAHPGRSPWIAVNRRAVPACTGPNGKPTIAQFCAFAILPDGGRIITENSRGNPYCETLFAEWVEERTL